MTNPRRAAAARKGGKKSRKVSPWGRAPMICTERNVARHRRMYGAEESEQ
jgi:hypothetical protein